MRVYRKTKQVHSLRLPKRHVFRVSLVVLCLLVTSGLGVYSAFFPQNPAFAAGSSDDFVTTWKTDNEGVTNDTSIRIVAGGAGGGVPYNYEIDWDNDGEFDQTVTTEGSVDHDFGVPGEYTVRIRGDFHRLNNTWNNEDTRKLVSVDQWGAIKWRTMNYSFANMPNLDVRAIDAPDLSMATDISAMFSGSSNVDADFSHWDTSTIINMSGMFQSATSFNGDVSSWDTSGVTDMSYMFRQATSFNQSLDNWDVSSVENMQGMFTQASSFNQSLGAWDISSLTSATAMLGEGGMSSVNYDATLIGWSSKPLSSGVSFLQQYGTYYCTDAGEQARQYIIDTYNWQVEDSGRRCGVVSLDGAENGYKELDEGMSAGSVVGALATDGFSPEGYSLTCENGGLDNALFAISGNELITQVSFDYDNPQSSNESNYYSVCVRAFGSDGRSVEANFIIIISNVVQMRLDHVNPGSVYIDSGDQPVGLSGKDLYDAVEVKFGDTVVDIVSQSSALMYVSVPTNGVLPGTVDVTVKDSSGTTVMLEDVFTYAVRQPKAITGVDLTQQNNQQLMIVHGSSLVEEHEIEDALVRSLVILNGQALPFCADGFGVSAADLVAAYGIEPSLVSDTPTCYQLVDFSDMENPYKITETQAIIWLSDDFDSDAEGTVSVNGSSSFTFNSDGDENEGSNPPSASANGDRPLENNPYLPKRPTFSGKATPGAHVVVTVHSDPISCSATADGSGNWSCTLPEDLEPGVHTVYVVITNPDNSVVNLGPYSVRVAGGETVIDSSTPLAPNTGVGLMERLYTYKQAQQTKMIYGVVGLSLVAVGGVLLVGSVLRHARRRRVAVFTRQ